METIRVLVEGLLYIERECVHACMHAVECLTVQGGGCAEAGEDGEGEGGLPHHLPARNQHPSQGACLAVLCIYAHVI